MTTTVLDFTLPPSRSVPEYLQNKLEYKMFSRLDKNNFAKYAEIILRLNGDTVDGWNYAMSIKLAKDYIADPTPENIKKLLPLLEKCIEHESEVEFNYCCTDAHEMMADMYYNGVHIPKDLCLAYKFYNIVAIPSYDGHSADMLEKFYEMGFPTLLDDEPSRQYEKWLRVLKKKFAKTYSLGFDTLHTSMYIAYKFVATLDPVVQAIRDGKTSVRILNGCVDTSGEPDSDYESDRESE